jgi:hypothetical protein
LIDFLQWKGSTHVIDNSNAKRTDQNGLKTMNRSKNERGENVLAKNTKNTSHKPNPGGHKVVMATIPITKLGSYTNLSICGPLSQNPKGEGKLREG